MQEIEELIKNGEHGNVEFKECLTRRVHLEKKRRHGLASQMKYRAVYLLGMVRMKFKCMPNYVVVGQKFVFREGKSKGIGVVTSIIAPFRGRSGRAGGASRRR